MGFGTRTERHLERLCRKSFLRMWAHRSPYRLQKASPNSTEGKELCDLLAILGQDIFIFSDKEVGWPKKKPLPVAWNRWYRKAIAESAKQLAGAERWLRSHPDRVFCDKQCSIPLPVGVPANPRFHFIAVAHGAAAACRAHYEGGSGSLMLQTRGREEEPFVVGTVLPDRFVHVLDEVALDIVLSNLDTFPEFLEYIVAKEAVWQNGKHIHATGEEDLLGHYLLTMDPGAALGHGLGDIERFTDILVTEDSWLDFRDSPQRAARDRANADSYLWDQMIERFARHSIRGTQRFSSTTDPSEFERVLRILNAEPRTARRVLVRQVMDRLGSMRGRPRRTWAAQSPSGQGTAFVFLAVREEPGESYDDYRERRLYMLEMCTALWRIRQPTVSAHVGVGLSPPEGDSSEDILLVDEKAWSSDLEKEAMAFQRETGMLKQVRESRRTEHEFPVLRPSRGPQGGERNRPCPCGSGLKWKRCCTGSG